MTERPDTAALREQLRDVLNMATLRRDQSLALLDFIDSLPASRPVPPEGRWVPTHGYLDVERCPQTLGDAMRLIGRYTESEGGDSTETRQARTDLFDAYETWCQLDRPESPLAARCDAPTPEAECERCGVGGCDIDVCEDCGEGYTDPCERHRSFGHVPASDAYTDGVPCSSCCTACHPAPTPEADDEYERWIIRQALADFAECEDEAGHDYKDSPAERDELARRASVARDLIARFLRPAPIPATEGRSEGDEPTGPAWLRQALDIQTALLEDARMALEMTKDRLDEFTYSELAAPLDDSALDEFGEAYRSERNRLREEVAELRAASPSAGTVQPDPDEDVWGRIYVPDAAGRRWWPCITSGHPHFGRWVQIEGPNEAACGGVAPIAPEEVAAILAVMPPEYVDDADTVGLSRLTGRFDSNRKPILAALGSEGEDG